MRTTEPGGTAPTDRQAARDELRERLRRQPAEAYPVPHATARFHLGALLLDDDRPTEALDELGVAAELFQPRLPVEFAKTLNLVGAAARRLGDVGAARTSFQRAAALLEEHGQRLEAAAARYNLGLAALDDDAAEEAVTCFQQAREAFAAGGARTQAAAAAREAGSAQLQAGDVDGAVTTLRAARDEAGALGDAAAAGATANALGLAELAADRLDEAVAAFDAAVADHPRGLRPDGHAMANANLAVAHERAGRPAHARLAARHALALGEAPPSVRAQAEAVLERLGDPDGDVLLVLDATDPDRWSTILRAEVSRQVELEPSARRREAAAWVEGVLARRAGMMGRLEAWLAAVLELPTTTLEAAVTATVAAASELPADDQDAFLRAVRRGTARFHTPQMTRLEQLFGAAAAAHGVEARWT